MKARSVDTAVAQSMTYTAAVALGAMVTGEMKKVDEATGKITLKHGPIESMDDGMTMVFRVQDASMPRLAWVGDTMQPEAEGAAASTKIKSVGSGGPARRSSSRCVAGPIACSDRKGGLA